MKKLVEKLTKEFPVKVCTEFHLQIETVNGPHNIWFSKKQGLKLQRCGEAEVLWVGEGNLFNILRRYDYNKTTLATMRKLSEFIREIEGKEGIFVDAGFKGGKARVAIVNSKKNGDMDISVRNIEAVTNIAAEKWAIEEAAKMYFYGTIYSDCQPAANTHPRAVWIPRNQNKNADRFGNMRGVADSPIPDAQQATENEGSK